MEMIVHNSQGASETYQGDSIQDLMDTLENEWSDPENVSARIHDEGFDLARKAIGGEWEIVTPEIIA